MPERRLEPVATVDPTAVLRDAALGRYVEVGPRTSLVESSLDDYSYVMNDCDLMYVQVGRFCSIASHVRLNPSNHPIWRASQHHFTYRSELFGMGPDDAEFFDWRRAHPVILGHDVWIGHGAIVLPGARVGDGAVIGAGAVVTRDVPPWTIMVGAPARPLRERFSADVQQELRRIAWWNWDHETLAARVADFRALDIHAFIEKYG